MKCQCCHHKRALSRACPHSYPRAHILTTSEQVTLLNRAVTLDGDTVMKVNLIINLKLHL